MSTRQHAMQRFPELLHFSTKMSDARNDFLKLAEQTLNFEMLCVGDNSGGHYTGWRTLPCAVISHFTGTTLHLDLDAGTLKARDRAYCMTPGIHHCSRSEGGRCRWIHANFTLFGGVNIFTFLSLPPILSRKASNQAAHLNGALAALDSDLATLKDIIIRKSLGFQLLVAILEDATLRQDHPAFIEGAQRLSPALMYIRENLSRSITLNDLARLTHLSPSRFSAIFRSSFAISPRSYLQRERLQKAQELLIHSNMGIGAIGERVGWDNPYFFSRIFRKKCGQTPSDYRFSVRKGITS
jgi:AraC-like DNA-binding protein